MVTAEALDSTVLFNFTWDLCLRTKITLILMSVIYQPFLQVYKTLSLFISELLLTSTPSTRFSQPTEMLASLSKSVSRLTCTPHSVLLKLTPGDPDELYLHAS